MLAITSWSTGTTYAPQACGSLRSLYHMLALLRRSRYQSVKLQSVSMVHDDSLFFGNLWVLANDYDDARFDGIGNILSRKIWNQK